MDYINSYQAEAQNDRISRYSEALGVDEEKLRAMMKRGVNSDNINEYGLFDQLKESVDAEKAKAYFEEKEGQQLKMFRVKQRIDESLRKFILSGGADE